MIERNCSAVGTNAAVSNAIISKQVEEGITTIALVFVVSRAIIMTNCLSVSAGTLIRPTGLVIEIITRMARFAYVGTFLETALSKSVSVFTRTMV